MAIRRPSIYSPTWVFQDFLYQESSGTQERTLQVKWDGENYDLESQTFDYSNPPYTSVTQHGGNIVAEVNYTVQGTSITITDWEVNWRDEWPLRLAANYLLNCLYPGIKGYIIRVRGEEVYDQTGKPISVQNKDAYAFWVSETIFPITNTPNDYLYR